MEREGEREKKLCSRTIFIPRVVNQKAEYWTGMYEAPWPNPGTKYATVIYWYLSHELNQPINQSILLIKCLTISSLTHNFYGRESSSDNRGQDLHV